MENPIISRACCFQWVIFNPFIPWRNLEATFYHEFPTVTQWKAIIRPVYRHINFWQFTFALEFDEWFDPRYEIVAERLKVYIKLNEALIAKKKVSNYCFSRGNKYTFGFDAIAEVYPQMEPYHFYIRIDISLPGIAATRREVGNGICTDDDDLISLSYDLGNLLRRSLYSNMELMPSNSSVPIQAHSYILDARWENFSCLHPLGAGTVETNISSALLMDILTYMYTGVLRRNWPDWKSSAYITELFQVMDRYKLYHLYKVFVKGDSEQVRVTRNSVLIESCLFPLDVFNGLLVSDSSETWLVDPKPGYKFVFKIRIWKDDQYHPWLSYSLLSKSSQRVHVRVNLEVVKREERRDPRRVRSLHAQDYIIDPNGTVGPGGVLFFGCPERPVDFDASEGSEIEFFIRSFLNIVDGETLTQVRSEHDNELVNDLERFVVLGDHMHRMRTRRLDATLRIRSRSGGFRYLDEHVYQEDIHKGIFASRVPRYWEGLENVPRPNDLPDTVVSTLSNETLPMLLDFIYTGQVSTIPLPLLFEIEDFADGTLFSSLKDLANRIRSHFDD